MAVDFTPGVYRHYKGGTYLAMSVAYHERTAEPMVVYIQIEEVAHRNPKALQFVRPLKEWTELVSLDTPMTAHTRGPDVMPKRMPRFTLIKPLGP
jgi:hypothetical protein